MKNMHLIVISTLALSSTAYGAGVGTFDVVAVGCMPNGTCYVQISPAATTSTCPLTNQIRFDISLAGSKSQYAAALSAQMAGKQISAYLTDNCLNNFPIPDFLQANK